MRVRAQSIGSCGRGTVWVERLDTDGEVYIDMDAFSYLDAGSVRRLIRALQWSIRPPKRRTTKRR